MLHNLVYGNYVTSATFCMKLGKGEITALDRLSQSKKLREGTDACFWNLASKGLIQTDADRYSTLTEAGELAVLLLQIAGLIAVDVPNLVTA